MKVLHIGYGFRSLRMGGLIEYAEDLMDVQVARGYEVGYFCSGRNYPFLKKSWLKKWSKKKISIYEIINSYVAQGFERLTKYPDVDINEESSEKFFIQVLSDFKPEVIHIQELLGLPSSLIEIIKFKNIPVLMTLHDYFTLCPTVQLFDYNKTPCLKENIGEICQICYNPKHRSYNEFLESTLEYEKRQSPFIQKTLFRIFNKLRRQTQRLSRLLFAHPSDKYLHNSSIISGLSERYQKRRDTNIERLNKVDLLIAQSFRVAEIYRTLGVQANNITTVHSTVKHINDITPKTITSLCSPIHFATINGLASPFKGAYLILETLYKLKESGLTSQFKLVVMGHVGSEIKNELLQFENVIYKGSYQVADLNNLLEEIHVGIIPSIWEEVYGYVGIEFLAKGIPVIGNKMGGIVDYTINNVTGWLNEANTAEGLAQIMTDIIHNPNQILDLNQSIISNNNQMIKSMDQHFEEIDKLYRELVQAKQNE